MDKPSRRTVMVFLGGCAAGVGAVAIGSALYIAAGVFNTAAAVPHNALSYWATKAAMIRSVKVRAPSIVAPARFTPAQTLAGFCAYETDCVACHGAPAIPRAPWVDGLTPPPPYLIDARQQWTRSELFLIVRGGVKMTGMPAWDRTRSDRDIWNLVAFLEAMPKMDSTGYGRMRAAGLCEPKRRP